MSDVGTCTAHMAVAVEESAVSKPSLTGAPVLLCGD